MKVKVNDFHLCEFCHVETTAPLLYIEIEGFDLDICPACYHSLDHGVETHFLEPEGDMFEPRGEEE